MSAAKIRPGRLEPVDSARRRALQQDRGGERLFQVLPLCWCVAFCLGVALEIARPGSLPPELLAALAAAAAGLGLAPKRPRAAALAVVLAAGLAGTARAALERQEPTEPPTRGLVRVTITGASAPTPGGCAVSGRPEGMQAQWLLQVPGEICPLAAGDPIWVGLGDLAPRGTPPWPGASRIAPAREGAVAAFTAAEVWRANSPAADGYWHAVARLRHEAVAAGRGEPALGFVVASVLGQPAALAPERRSELRRAGLGHVVAVSGMNVAVAAALVQAPLLRLGLVAGGSLGLAALLGWVPVLAYLGLTGGAPPALRAAVMFGLGQAATLTGRPGHGLTALALTAAAMLAWRPAWASDPGLHLSLAAMAVLVHPEAPRGLVAQSWRVSFGTLPIVLVHFGQASLVGVVANVIAVPVFTLWVLPLGMLGLLMTPWWGTAALAPAALGGQLVVDVAALASRAPEPPGWTLAGLAAIGLGLRTLGGRWLARRHEVAAWVPGSLACAAVLAAVASGASQPAPQEEPRAWVAIGGPRSAAVVWPAEPGGRAACVRDPWLNPEAWPDLLAELGFTTAAGVEARRSPPVAAAVRAELTRAGMLLEGTCPEGPKLKALASSLKACQGQSRQRRAVVRAGPEGPECWVDGRFVPLAPAG